MAGIEQIKKIIAALGEIVNVGHKVANGSGVFAAFSLTDELSALSSVQKDELLEEMKDLSSEERAELAKLFKEKVDLSDDALESKIEDGADSLDELVSLGFEAKEVVEKGILLVAKVKALFA